MAKIGNLHEVGSWKLEVFQKQTFLYFFTFRHAFRTRFLIFRQSSILKKIKELKQCFNRGWNSRTVFLFTFLNYPVKIFSENFSTLDCFVPRNDSGILITFSTLKTIDARFARAKTNFYRSYGAHLKFDKIPYKPSVPTEQITRKVFQNKPSKSEASQKS